MVVIASMGAETQKEIPVRIAEGCLPQLKLISVLKSTRGSA